MVGRVGAGEAPTKIWCSGCWLCGLACRAGRAGAKDVEGLR